MGHQILGLALGGKTFKLPFGHHGLNHPDRHCQNGVAITSQNHGFSLDADSLPNEVRISNRNLNDGSISGLEHRSLPVFSVQYHPEASPGPHDADGLFAKFVRLMQEN
jgi:carbamoyl-phosphate synthase small subunit